MIEDAWTDMVPLYPRWSQSYETNSAPPHPGSSQGCELSRLISPEKLGVDPTLNAIALYLNPIPVTLRGGGFSLDGNGTVSLSTTRLSELMLADPSAVGATQQRAKYQWAYRKRVQHSFCCTRFYEACARPSG
jgi:hypothetical protein